VLVGVHCDRVVAEFPDDLFDGPQNAVSDGRLATEIAAGMGIVTWLRGSVMT
jgi:hypothetical protein